MKCVATFRGGPYFDVRTKDCEEFWNLRDKKLTAQWEDGRFEQYLLLAHKLPVDGVDNDPDSDGVTMPVITRVVRPTLRDRIFGAGFVHDAAFRKLLLVLRGENWVNANLSEEDANALILALMFIEDASEFERQIVYQALQAFGKTAYDEDAAKVKPEDFLPGNLRD